MDPKPSSPFALAAPTASHGGAARLPAHAPPGLDDRLVTPESREEMLRGVQLYAAPSAPEHGDPHCTLDFLVSAHARPTYRPSSDLLTRVADDSDFAADTSVRRAGRDPATGGRYLEELAFEVVNTTSRAEITAKAQAMTVRGVRRVFAVFVGTGQVCEWRVNHWQPFTRDAVIDDPCLVHPLEIAAILDAALAEDAAVRALAAKGNPELLRREREAAMEFARTNLMDLIAERGWTLTDNARDRIARASDADTLRRWIRGLLRAESLDALLSG